jgi:hypothetical protein
VVRKISLAEGLSRPSERDRELLALRWRRPSPSPDRAAVRPALERGQVALHRARAPTALAAQTEANRLTGT